jgi:hypothetical protein
MNAFDLMRTIGFGGGASAASSYFITSKSSVSFTLRAPVGYILHIDWGNGDAEDIAMTGSNIGRTKNYGSELEHIITFSGNGNAALEHITCNNNSFTSMSIELNLSLMYFDCSNNLLPSLNVSSNTQLRRLACGSNSLNSATINAVLSRLATNNVSNEHLICSGQSPAAPPTGQGIIDKATLINRGWIVTTD